MIHELEMKKILDHDIKLFGNLISDEIKHRSDKVLVVKTTENELLMGIYLDLFQRNAMRSRVLPRLVLQGL